MRIFILISALLHLGANICYDVIGRALPDNAEKILLARLHFCTMYLCFSLLFFFVASAQENKIWRLVIGSFNAMTVYNIYRYAFTEYWIANDMDYLGLILTLIIVPIQLVLLWKKEG